MNYIGFCGGVLKKMKIGIPENYKSKMGYCEEQKLWMDCPHIFKVEGKIYCLEGTFVCHGFCINQAGKALLETILKRFGINL